MEIENHTCWRKCNLCWREMFCLIRLSEKKKILFIFCMTIQSQAADRRRFPSSRPPVFPSLPTSCSTSPLFRLNRLSALGHSYDSSVCHIEDGRQTDSQRARFYLWRANRNLLLEASFKKPGNLCCLQLSSLDSWQFSWLNILYYTYQRLIGGWKFFLLSLELYRSSTLN